MTITATLKAEPICPLLKHFNEYYGQKLANIARSIGWHTRSYHTCLVKAAFYAKEIGEELQTAKSMTPYGQWTSWVKEHCPFSPRTARNYLSIAENWQKITQSAGNADPSTLTITEALKLLKGSQKPSLRKKNQKSVYVLLPYDLNKFHESIAEQRKHFERIPQSAWSNPNTKEDVMTVIQNLQQEHQKLGQFLNSIGSK